MKLGILKIAAFILIVLFFVAGNSCRNRFEEPVISNDSTIVYQSKKSEDVSAKITFCRKIEKNSENYVGEGTIFTITNESRVRAVIELENLFNNGYEELMFHIDWVGPDDKSIYLKRTIITPDDSISTIESSISVSTDTREPGEYTLKIYYFRELIAEKSFEMLRQFHISELKEMGFSNELILYKDFDKKTGKLQGIDTIFFLGDENNVRAKYNLPHLDRIGNRELLFYFDWIGPDNSSFYKKEIEMTFDNADESIGSSISISPDKRDTGNYVSQLYLFDELIAEKKFRVTLKPELPPIELNTNIILYRKLDKKTGKRVDEGTVFTIKNKRKVRALINIKNRQKYIDREIELTLNWIGPDGKSFYDKKYYSYCW